MGVSAGLYMYDVVIKKFTFAISSPDEFLFFICARLYNFVLTLVFGGRPIITCVFYNVSAWNAHSVDNTRVVSCVFISLLCNN